MKLLSLNIWGGIVFEPLMDFLRQQAKDTDIFCFQEVFSAKGPVNNLPSGSKADIFEELQKILDGYESLFYQASESYDMGRVKVDAGFTAGHAFFIKKGIPFRNTGFFHTHSEVPITHTSGFVSSANLGGVTIMNIHGLWTGKGKGDDEQRLEQSRKLKSHMDGLSGKKILCGDFNLNPETESLKVLEQGMTNLIKKFDIPTTRSSLYRYFGEMKFADYVLVSPEVKVVDFLVPNVAVSDHLPMILEFA